MSWIVVFVLLMRLEDRTVLEVVGNVEEDALAEVYYYYT